MGTTLLLLFRRSANNRVGNELIRDITDAACCSVVLFSS